MKKRKNSLRRRYGRGLFGSLFGGKTVEPERRTSEQVNADFHASVEARKAARVARGLPEYATTEEVAAERAQSEATSAKLARQRSEIFRRGRGYGR